MSEVNGHSGNELPTGWRMVKVSDLGRIETGSTPSKKNEDYYADEFPFYKPTDLEQGYNVRKASDNLSSLGIKQARFLPEHSILVTCIGATIGKTGIIRRAGACNQQINAIIPSKDYNSNFIYYQVIGSTFQKKIKDNASSTTLPILNKSKFQNLDFVVCQLEEQQQIVYKIEELFSELDKSIEQLKTAQQQIKVYRQSVLKWAFEGKLTNNNVPRTGFEPVSIGSKAEAHYDIKNTLLPEGWKWAKLGDVVSGVEYGSSAKSKEIGKVPVLRMGNIQRGRFDWADLVYTDDEEEIKKYFLEKNDVLFNRTNSPELVGKTAIYKGERPAIFAGYLIRINRIEELINADYLNYFLNSDVAKHYGNSVKTDGVNQSNINGQKLKGYPIPLASFDEQIKVVQEIESRLSVADKLEETITNSLQHAETLRQSILKKAFEGQL